MISEKQIQDIKDYIRKIDPDIGTIMLSLSFMKSKKGITRIFKNKKEMLKLIEQINNKKKPKLFTQLVYLYRMTIQKILEDLKDGFIGFAVDDDSQRNIISSMFVQIFVELFKDDRLVKPVNEGSKIIEPKGKIIKP